MQCELCVIYNGLSCSNGSMGLPCGCSRGSPLPNPSVIIHVSYHVGSPIWIAALGGNGNGMRVILWFSFPPSVGATRPDFAKLDVRGPTFRVVWPGLPGLEAPAPSATSVTVSITFYNF